MLSLDHRVSMSPDVVYRTLGDEAVVLNLDSGMYFGLNGVGNRIWELVLEHDLRTVCELLSREFDAPRDVIERDVIALVQALLEKKLVVHAGEGAPK
jgi:hypothetical protein